MIRWFLGVIAAGPYYIRINRERISVRNVSSGDSFECRALVGIDSANRVVSVGLPVSPDAVKQLNPFEHPRVLVDDFTIAEKVFAYAVRKVSGMSLLSPSPIVVVHPDLELDGGLAAIESRVLSELSEGAGARKTVVHYGPVLSDEGVTKITSEA